MLEYLSDTFWRWVKAVVVGLIALAIVSITHFSTSDWKK